MNTEENNMLYRATAKIVLRSRATKRKAFRHVVNQSSQHSAKGAMDEYGRK